MLSRKRYAAWREVFTDLGAVIEDTSISGGSHIRFLIRLGDVRRIFFAPLSCGDHRGLKNFRSDVRRWARGLKA